MKDDNIISRNIKTYKIRKLNLFLSQFAYEPVSKHKAIRFSLRSLKFKAKNRRILDIGFGNGINIFSFDKSNEVCGIEITQNMVDFANRMADKNGYSGYKFKLYDGFSKIDFDKCYFDLVICSHVIEHVPDDIFLLTEMSRLLKQEGIAVILIPVGEVQDEKDIHERAYDIKKFRNLLKSMDFNICLEFEFDKFSNSFRSYLKKKDNIFYKIRWALTNIICSKIPFRIQRKIEKIFINQRNTQYIIVVQSNTGNSK